MNNIDVLEEFIKSIKNFNNYKDETNVSLITKKQVKSIETLIVENKKLKEEKRGLEIKASELNGLAEVVQKDYIPKSKIKAKIEEINKEMLNEENSLELFYRKKYCKEVLQSFLGKE